MKLSNKFEHVVGWSERTVSLNLPRLEVIISPVDKSAETFRLHVFLHVPTKLGPLSLLLDPVSRLTLKSISSTHANPSGHTSAHRYTCKLK